LVSGIILGGKHLQFHVKNCHLIQSKKKTNYHVGHNVKTMATTCSKE
jgi:hypothetical protein